MKGDVWGVSMSQNGTVRTVSFDSFIFSPSVGKYLHENTRRLITRSTGFNDGETPGKSKPARRRRRPAGTWEEAGSQWVKRAAQAASANRHCGAGWLR